VHLTYVWCKISIVECPYQSFIVAVSNVCYLCFMKHYYRRIFISKFQYDNLIIDGIRSNYLNLSEIMCSYAGKNFENLKQLV
jgi:hypothetical protein